MALNKWQRLLWQKSPNNLVIGQMQQDKSKRLCKWKLSFFEHEVIPGLKDQDLID